MQWLIDLIKEWVQAQGYLTTAFVDRGDPAAVDYTGINFIKDNTWRDLDLSEIIPANAKAVLFTLLIISMDELSSASFRRKGNVNAASISRSITQVSIIDMQSDLVCPLDSDRKIQYRFTADDWLTINFTVKGWWL